MFLKNHLSHFRSHCRMSQECQLKRVKLALLLLAMHISEKLCVTFHEKLQDVSGMPGICRPVEEGGVGFDFRLAMAIPDKWIKLLKETSDDDWNMGNIVHTLTNRRWMEKAVAYAESHDQVINFERTLLVLSMRMNAIVSLLPRTLMRV